MDASSAREFIVAPQYPGSGPACFRVQLFSREQSQWLMHATFRSRGAADECVAKLRERGLAVRMIRYNALPTAA